MSIKDRLFNLLISCLPPAAIYSSTSYSAAYLINKVQIIPETYIDRLIPFDASGIWLYFLFYLYILYTFLIVSDWEIKPLRLSFIISACVSGIIFVTLPTSIVYPTFEIDGISSSFLSFLVNSDTTQNCFPSLHGSLLTICTMAIWDKSKKSRSIICLLLTLLMYHSIIQVRRHLFIDLVAGILLGFTAYLVSTRFIAHKRLVTYE
jgi:membrane-associated phospholipid phosphatase